MLKPKRTTNIRIPERLSPSDCVTVDVKNVDRSQKNNSFINLELFVHIGNNTFTFSSEIDCG